MSHEKPTALPHNPAGVPDAMKSAPRWVLWRYELRGEKWTKVPRRVDGGNASSTDSTTWAAYGVALAAYNADGGCDGLGFVLGDGWAGVDVDNESPEAMAVMESLSHTYQERSPGGVGWHAIGYIDLKTPLKGSKRHGIEQYSGGRYFTVTGQQTNGKAPANITTQVLAIHRKHNPPPVPKTYTELESKVAAAEPELWAGDTSKYGGDHSAADLALVGCIAFYTQDHEAIDAIFRNSGLYREKWERLDYRTRTIERAISTKTKFADPVGEKPRKAAIDEKTERLILSTSRTLPTAQSFMAEFYPDNSLVAHGGLLYGWTGSHYEQLEPDMIRNKLQRWLHEALHIVKVGKTLEKLPFPANASTIDSALSAIKSYRSVLSSTVSPPAWIDGGSGPDPKQILFGKTKMTHMPSGVELPCTPRMFNLTSIDADYDPDAPEPEKWLEFLHQLWGNDNESIAVLQQWFGYCLTADTSQQKALLLIGPKRGGKGTIARVLRRLVGERNCTGPMISSLAGPFGLAPLVGKSLAVIGDARFHGDNIRIVVERLLSIIGEDPVTVDRKHLDSLEVRLPTRFLFLTNEQPKFTDASGALPSRFIVLELFESFYGRENLQLEEELIAELPGILRWAVDGWTSLQEQGRLRSPAATATTVAELDELASPVLSFVRERCVVGKGKSAFTDTLYAAWCEWSKSEGVTKPTTKLTFVKDLRAVLPRIKRERDRATGAWFYDGIELAVTGGIS